MNPESFLNSSNDHEVKYVIGATAFPIHGDVRVTIDVDVLIEPNRNKGEENAGSSFSFGV